MRVYQFAEPGLTGMYRPWSNVYRSPEELVASEERGAEDVILSSDGVAVPEGEYPAHLESLGNYSVVAE